MDFKKDVIVIINNEKRKSYKIIKCVLIFCMIDLITYF